MRSGRAPERGRERQTANGEEREEHMSTFEWREMKCAVCGLEAKYFCRKGTGAYGSPDLDLRPPELLRSTMPTWVHQCPNCGYAAKDLEAETSVTGEFLETEAYRTCDGLGLEDPVTVMFYHRYLCDMEEKDVVRASLDLLYAAWCCDDNDEEDLAVTLRKKSVALMDQYLPECIEGEAKERFLLMRSDMLRRSGQFDRVLAEYGPERFTAENHPQIAAFEQALARAKDTKRYTVREALEETGGAEE